MKKTTRQTLFYEDKPLFGMDIGHRIVHVAQLKSNHKNAQVVGYGETSFDENLIQEGVITEPEEIAKTIQALFRHHLVGDITTNRVALSVPTARAFTRTLDVPTMSEKDVRETVTTEVEQYIPMPADELYIDYSCLPVDKKKMTIFIVAIPRKIVDSHILLARLLGLEPVLIQTSSNAGANLFSRDPQSDLPSVLVDFGSNSADITIYDKAPIVSSVAPCGGDQMTDAIVRALGVTPREATIIKSKYGLNVSKKQKQIEECLTPIIGLLTKEIRRTVRYHEERSKSKRSISQIVVMGGAANTPGLTEFLTSDLRMPVRALDPTSYLEFGKLQPFTYGERMSYVTAAGLSLYNPHEVFP